MSHSLLLGLLVVSGLWSVVNSGNNQRIWFPGEKKATPPEKRAGDSCVDEITGASGTCGTFGSCQDFVLSDAEITPCTTSGTDPLICCPKEDTSITISKPLTGPISEPILYYDPIGNASHEPKTPILQAVKLEVFDVGVCDQSYSQLIDYWSKWPQGMTKDRVLCSGWRDGGRDSCKGDSGGPLSYFPDSGRFKGRFTLAGIVSTGFGCGLKEYPGIYIPVNSPGYLQWIKDIAFKDYPDSALNPRYDTIY